MISFEEHDGDKRYAFDENILRSCGFDKEDFEEIPGRYFYNRGATYNQYLNLYWNDPSQFVTYDVSAIYRQDTELVERFNNEPIEVFKAIRKIYQRN